MFKKLISIILISAIMATFAIPAAAAGGTFRVAKIDSFDGDVKIKKAGGEKSFNAFAGMNLAQGDSLTTGKNSSAVLFIDDDKEVTIGANTKICMSELSGRIDDQNDKTGIKLFFGKLFSNIKKKLNIRSKFEIKTPTAVAGARGTQFYVGQEDGSTDIAVLDGTVVATTYIPVEDQGDEGGQQEIEVVLEQNQQVTLDGSLESQDDVDVEQVTQDSLDLFVLETIQENPEGVDPSLLQGIDQIIEQQQEEQQQEEQQQEEQQQQQEEQQQNSGPPQIVYDDAVTPPPAPTYTPTPPPASPPPAPTVTIVSPENSSYLQNGIDTILVTVAGGANVSAVKVAVSQGSNYLNGSGNFTGTKVYLNADLIENGWSLPINEAAIFQEGESTIEAYAFDGTNGPITTSTVTIDNTTPSAVNISIQDKIPANSAVTLTAIGGPLSDASWEYIRDQILSCTDPDPAIGTWITGVDPLLDLSFVISQDGETAILKNNNLATDAVIVSDFGFPGEFITDRAGNIAEAFIVIDAKKLTVNAVLSYIDSAHVEISFSEPVDSVSATSSTNYVLSGTGNLGGITTPTGVSQKDDKTYELTVPDMAGWTMGDTLTVTVNGVTDIAGNAIAGNNIATYTRP